MRNVRTIARLDIKGKNLIKSINLEGLKKIGDPGQFAKKYYDKKIDELIFIDTVATLYGRNQLHDILIEASKEIFVPITIGGGIRTLDDAEKSFMAGADKVFINSQAVKNPNFISELSKKFGSQSVVVNIEVKKFSNNKWEVFITNGRDRTEIEVIDWIKKCESLGAGEIMITSIDNEGTGKGSDLELLNLVQDSTKLPLVYSGGIGSLQDIKDLSEIKIDGLALSRVLHYNLLEIHEIKNALNFDK
jgi:cyclase